MIADSHTHIFPPEIVKERERFFDKEPAFRLLYENPKSRLIDSGKLLLSMEKEKVELSVIFGFPWQSAGLCRKGNDYVINQAILNPGKFAPFITLPCCAIDEALKEIERCSTRKIAGIGELSFYCCDDHEVKMTWYREVAKAAKHHGLPMLWHVTEDVGHNYPGKGGMNPKEAVELITQLQDQIIILAHWGGGLPFFELMPEISKCFTSVYYDTAASPFLYDKKIFEATVSLIGHKRILFGSDYPLVEPKRYIDQVRQTNLSKRQKEAILGNNLVALLEKVSK